MTYEEICTDEEDQKIKVGDRVVSLMLPSYRYGLSDAMVRAHRERLVGEVCSIHNESNYYVKYPPTIGGVWRYSADELELIKDEI